MPGGFLGKILFVDLTSQQIVEEKLDESVYRDFLGGYGIGVKLLYERMPPGVDPLGPENIFGILAGPLTGTSLPFVSRFTVVGKSPLTGCWGDANGSGAFGPAIKKAGYDGIFFTGNADRPVYLIVGGDNGPTIADATQLWGKDTYFTEDFVKNTFGPKAEAACIGPAGEKCSRLAAVITGKGRAAARAGLGGVMGSKNLKAVVALAGGRVPLADPEKVAELKKKYTEQMRYGIGFSDFYRGTGTPGYLQIAIANGDSPVRNWGGDVSELEDTSELQYENIKNRYLARKKTCYECPMADWGHVMVDKGPYKLEEAAHTPEYETSSVFGPYCLNTNYESIIKCNDICNRYGIDTISTGSAVAFTINCFENGILKRGDVDGLEPSWGDHEAIVRLTEKIAKREGFGDLLADGVKIAAEKIGNGAAGFAVHIGGQELPAHDPRFEPSMASIYRNNGTPGRHTQDAQFCVPSKLEELYPDADFSFSFGNIRKIMPGRAKAQKILSSLNHCVNSSGTCLFGFLSTEVYFMPECLAAVTGWDITLQELVKTGERIGDMRLIFTLREGINPLKLPVPGVAIGNPPLEKGPTKGVTVDLDLLSREFCAEMDWDIETGRPGAKRLTELNLGHLTKELWGQ